MTHPDITTPAPPGGPARLTGRRILRLYAALLLAALPAIVGRDVVRLAAQLYPQATAGNPYWAPEHALLLYVVAPLVALSACILFLAPGLLLAIAWNGARSAGQWVASGLALSLIVVSAATAAVQVVSGQPVQGLRFVGVVMGCALAALGVLWRRSRRATLDWPVAGPAAPFTLTSMAVAGWFLLAILAPKFYWENFNADGLESFAPGRLLLSQPVPFWDAAAGHIAAFPGITSMLFPYPVSWFIRLFGDFEACSRLPFVLYLAAMYGALVALIESGLGKTLRRREALILWMMLAGYVSVVAFSSTYEPYSADIGLPAAQDTLLMVCFLGFLLSFLQRQTSWLVLFALLVFLAEANGALLLVLWTAGVWLLWRPRPHDQLKWTAAALAGCVLVAVVLPPLLTLCGLPAPGKEHNFFALLYKYNFLQIGHWPRLLYATLPTGLLPACALFAWSRLDPVGRALAWTTGLYFLSFYVQAFTVLHYYVPAMVLPVAVFWRLALRSDAHLRAWLTQAAAVGAAVAFWVSFPTNRNLYMTARMIGATIEDRTPTSSAMAPEAFRRAEILWKLFPSDWEPEVPAKAYGGSALVWGYYARHSPASVPKNYILQLKSTPPPEQARRIAEQGDVALYVLSDTLWEQHRRLKPAYPAGNPFYAVPRWMLFGIHGYPRTSGPAVLDVLEALRRHGLDIKSQLIKLRVKR